MLTLLALGGAADGITTDGLRWPLHGETLAAGSTRGVSNEIVTGPVRIDLTVGTLLAVGTSPLERVDELLSKAGRRPGSRSGPGCS